MTYKFYEFFAGGGMARLGLGNEWECVFANDFDDKKATSYKANFGQDSPLLVDDVAKVTTSDLTGRADLAWASFPCQDLSLAGWGVGLAGGRSGTFWAFWQRMIDLRNEGRAPKLIVLENVYGAITSHGGRDLASIAESLVDNGYRFGVVVIDAAQFLPQSRPRMFIIAVDADIIIPTYLLSDGPIDHWHPDSLGAVYDICSDRVRGHWLWWNLSIPPLRQVSLLDIIEQEPQGVKWHTPLETKRLLSMMTPVNLAKVEAAKRAGGVQIGALYRRTRKDSDGTKRQRAEVRFDDVVGCLRTPSGGSSRQTLLIVEGNKIRSRLLSPREAARLMGLPDDYLLPNNYNEAYHLIGDGVAVPVVTHLTRSILEPMLKSLRGIIVA